jgi:hypothetical protein
MMDITQKAFVKQDSINVCLYYINMLNETVKRLTTDVERIGNLYQQESIRIIARNGYDVDTHGVVPYTNADGTITFVIVEKPKKVNDDKSVIQK